MSEMLIDALNQIIAEAEFSRDTYQADAIAFEDEIAAQKAMAWDQAVMAIQGLIFQIKKDVTL